MKSRLAILLVAVLVTGQVAGTGVLPVTISYGRSWPQSVVADSSQGLIFVDATSGIYPPTGFSFGVINASTHSLVQTLPLEVMPTALALDPTRGYVYVAGSGDIEVYSAGARAFVGNISIGLSITNMIVDSSGTGNLYLAAGHSVYEVSSPEPQTNGYTVVANVDIGTGAGGLAVDSASHRLFVADYASSSITVLDSRTLGVVGTIELSSCCTTKLALNSNTQTLYATTGTNYVDIVNAGTDSFVRSVQVAPYSTNSTSILTIDPVSGRVFVSFSAGGSVAELGPDGVKLGYLRADTTPAGMAVDVSSGELYVSNYHQVTVFDAGSSVPGPDFAVAGLAALGAAVAAAVLILVLRSPTWKNRNRV